MKFKLTFNLIGQYGALINDFATAFIESGQRSSQNIIWFPGFEYLPLKWARTDLADIFSRALLRILRSEIRRSVFEERDCGIKQATGGRRMTELRNGFPGYAKTVTPL